MVSMAFYGYLIYLIYKYVKVVKLKRIRIMNIELNDLPAGATRKIEGSEYEKLMNLINKK